MYCKPTVNIGQGRESKNTMFLIGIFSSVQKALPALQHGILCSSGKLHIVLLFPTPMRHRINT